MRNILLIVAGLALAAAAASCGGGPRRCADTAYASKGDRLDSNPCRAEGR